MWKNTDTCIVALQTLESCQKSIIFDWQTKTSLCNWNLSGVYNRCTKEKPLIICWFSHTTSIVFLNRKRILIGKVPATTLKMNNIDAHTVFSLFQNVIVSRGEKDQLATHFGRSRHHQNGGNVFRRGPRRGPQAEVQARCRRGERKITIYSHFLWHGPRSWITNSYLLGS